MLLKTRLMLIVAGVMLALTAGQFAFQASRDATVEEAYADRLADSHRALWDRVLQDGLGALAGLGELLRRETALGTALDSQSASALNDLARSLFARMRQDAPDLRFTIIDDRGEVRASLGIESGQYTPLLPNWLIRQVAESGEPLAGLRPDRDGVPWAVRAQPLAGGETDGVIVLARPVTPIVGGFAAAARSEAVLLDTEGAVVQVTGPVEWDGVAARVDLNSDAEQQVRAGDVTYAATALPLRNMAGGSVGTLVLLDDVTALSERLTVIDTLFYAVLVAVVVLLLLILFVYLRQTFEPLDDALTVLDGLSRRDTQVWIERVDGADEIGRLGRSVASLRDSIKALNAIDKQRGRRRLRQERFIRSQMTELARSLDTEAADGLLRELADIEQEAAATADTSGDDLTTLAQAFRHMAGRVGEQHLKLTELVAELREALAHKTKLISLQQELDIAQKIQLSVIPQTFPKVESFEVYGRMIPAREVGGDFFDVVQIDSHRIGIAVADVSGKGIPAAFFMLIARTLLKATALFGMTPGRCLEKLNDLLAVENDQMMFVTMFYGILDCRTGVFTYANGGHNPPILVHKDGGASELPTTDGMALAVMDGLDYREHSITLAPGDAVCMFTDGVTEAFDAADTLYGEPRLLGLVDKLAPPEATGLVDGVVDDVIAFAEGVPQADDITCVSVVFHKTAHEYPRGDHGASADAGLAVTGTAAVLDDTAAALDRLAGTAGDTGAVPASAGAAATASDFPTADAVPRAPEAAVSFKLPVPEGTVTRATEAAEDFIGEQDLPPAVGFQLSMVLDELVSNIIKYGFKPEDARNADIRLTLWREGDRLWVELSDDGAPFNPFAAEEPDTDLPLEDRPIGGLGIHLVRSTMEVHAYRRDGARNVVTLGKTVPA